MRLTHCDYEIVKTTTLLTLHPVDWQPIDYLTEQTKCHDVLFNW